MTSFGLTSESGPDIRDVNVTPLPDRMTSGSDVTSEPSPLVVYEALYSSLPP